ncbi:MAG: hypothetical protein ACM3L6_02215 [Deltaproteobacteria bacterium]
MFPCIEQSWRQLRGRRGSILFVAVGAVLVLSILALGATSSVMQELRLAQAVVRSSQIVPAALAAKTLAQYVLAYDETPTCIVQYDLETREVPFGDKRLRIELFDEQSLLPLPQASGGELVRLPGLDDGAVAGNLAEAEICVKEDATRVSGVTPEIYAQFAPYVTTFSDGSVNINTAGPACLTALGMDKALIEAIQDLRAGDDGTWGTEDDFWFLTPASIAPALQDYKGIGAEDAALISALVAQNKLGTSSGYIRVTATLLKGARVEAKAALVAQLASDRIVAWYEE